VFLALSLPSESETAVHLIVIDFSSTITMLDLSAHQRPPSFCALQALNVEHPDNSAIDFKFT
jgi:hypothetical protein